MTATVATPAGTETRVPENAYVRRLTDAQRTAALMRMCSLRVSRRLVLSPVGPPLAESAPLRREREWILAEAAEVRRELCEEVEAIVHGGLAPSEDVAVALAAQYLDWAAAFIADRPPERSAYLATLVLESYARTRRKAVAAAPR